MENLVKIYKMLDKFIKYDKATGNFEIDPYMRYVGDIIVRRFTDLFVEVLDYPEEMSHP